MDDNFLPLSQIGYDNVQVDTDVRSQNLILEALDPGESLSKDL